MTPQKWIKNSVLLLAGWWGPIQITNGKNFIQKLMWCGYTICLTNWRAKYCTRTRRARHIGPPSKKCDTWKTVSFNSILPTLTLPLPQLRLLQKAQQRQLNRIYMLSLNFNVNLSDIDCVLVAVGSSGILKGKQKLGVTFNSNKLGVIDFTKFSKLTMCSA